MSKPAVQSKKSINHPLDKLLATQDAKLQFVPNVYDPKEKGKPRQPFDGGVPKKEQSFSRLTLKKAFRMLTVMPFLLLKMIRSGNFYKKPFTPQKTVADAAFFEELEALAKSLGASSIGYVPDIPDEEIFNNTGGVPYKRAIVFTVDMDKANIEKSPHFDSFLEVAKGYKNLATISNQLCAFMNKKGFAAYPGTALGGLTDYVAVAKRAGLGEIGYNGLLIAPGAGPRLRINTIYTNIENLPEPTKEHAWVRDFCASCKNCIRSCPAGAIYDQAQPRATGGATSIKYDACVNYFARDWGCAVCIKVCPFSSVGYDKVKAVFEAAQQQSDTNLLAPLVKNKEPQKIVIVGAGAAGIYLAEEVVKKAPHIQVDILDKMPIPFGLVRYGVAPDHPIIKTKMTTFEQILKHPNIRFFGNVQLGRDLSKTQLKAHYHALVVATGASRGRKLGIAGEDLKGMLPAPDFIYWYNAHPSYKNSPPDLSSQQIAIIGMGNVSLDIARILVKSPEELDKTDMAPYAVQALRHSKVRDIHIIGRRGPSQTSFTPKELVELAELPGVQLIVKKEDIEADQYSVLSDPLQEARAARNRTLFAQYAQQPLARSQFRIHFHFFSSPVGIEGQQQVTGLTLQKNQLKSINGLWKVKPTTEHWTLPVGMVLKSIGYESEALKEVTFDNRRGLVPNIQGRIINSEGHVLQGEYTTGWVRRGATGVIGTNKKDALEVAALLLQDLEYNPKTVEPTQDLASYLKEKQHPYVNKKGLHHLLQQEKQQGCINFRTGLKFDSIEAMLKVAQEVQ